MSTTTNAYSTDRYLLEYCEREYARQVLSGSEERRIRRLGIRDGERVLDVGCGGGQTLAAISNKHPGATLVGVDVDERVLKIGRELAIKHGIKSLELVHSSATGLPFPDASFDVAISKRTLMHLPVEKSLAELCRVVKPGGRLMIQCTPYEFYVGQIAKALRRGKIEWYGVYSLVNGSWMLATGRQLSIKGKLGNYQTVTMIRRWIGPRGFEIDDVWKDVNPVNGAYELTVFGRKTG